MPSVNAKKETFITSDIFGRSLIIGNLKYKNMKGLQPDLNPYDVKTNCCLCNIWIKHDDKRFMERGNICNTCNRRVNNHVAVHSDPVACAMYDDEQRDRVIMVKKLKLDSLERILDHYNRNHEEEDQRTEHSKTIANI